MVQGVGITVATYAGVNLVNYPGHTWWYLVNPVTGANNVVIEVSGASRIMGEAISFYGVDQVNPIRAAALDTAADSSMSVSVSAVVGDMMVGLGEHIGNNHSAARTMQAPLTSPYDRFTVGAATVAFGISAYVGHGLAVSSPQVCTILMDGWATNYWAGVALRPYVPALGRAVKYYFNIWDPKAQVRDRNDQPVPPNELDPDNWVEVQGHVLPDAMTYDTYIVDPTKARIVEVTAGEKGATIRANRSQFADVLISRASAGRA
jgi:hypothetical protein